MLCGVMKGVDKRVDKGFPWFFRHLKRMENYKIAKRVYVGECAGSSSVSRLQKRWIDTMKDYLKKRALDVEQVEWCMIGVNGRDFS